MAIDQIPAFASRRESQSTLPEESTVAAVSLSGPDAVYRAKLERGSFEVQRCEGCGRCQFYPRWLCRYCGSEQWQWVVPCGFATVYATTVVRRKVDQGGDYNVAIVELDEGPRMMTRVDGMSAEQVSIGMRVEAQVLREDGVAMLVFVGSAGQPDHG